MTILKYDPFSANNNAIKQISGAGQGAGGPNAYSDRAFLVSLINDLVDQINNGSGGSSGLTLLSSGTVINQQYADIGLPVGYYPIKLILFNVVLSVLDDMALIVSADNGATWVCDSVNLDSYLAGDAVANMFATETIAAPYGNTWDGWIFPGNSTFLFQFMGFHAVGGTGNTVELFNSSTLNKDAVVPPVKTRYNKIRIMPIGNSDNPPTSGETFSMDYLVLGVPS